VRFILPFPMNLGTLRLELGSINDEISHRRQVVQICSRCHAQSPDTASECINCQSDLSIYSTTAVALKRFQNNPRVRYVRVVVAHNCCPACREVEGAYDKNDPPKLPVEGCSHNLGCRCFYQPFLTEIFP